MQNTSMKFESIWILYAKVLKFEFYTLKFRTILTVSLSVNFLDDVSIKCHISLLHMLTKLIKSLQLLLSISCCKDTKIKQPKPT